MAAASIRTEPAPRASRPTLLIQTLLILGVIVALIVAPRPSGALLLVPLTADEAGTVNLALAHGATLLGPGPVRGSIIVYGARDALARDAIGRGTLTFSAIPLLCGAVGTTVGLA